MNKFIFMIASVFLLQAGCHTTQNKWITKEQIRIGSPAPTIAVTTWVKGMPPRKPDPDKITIVEFWATWCGPCIGSIPHLNELSKKYEKEATFISVAACEQTEPSSQRMETFEKWVANWKGEINYNIVYDDSGVSWNSWMTAAGQSGIPTAFIVGRDNKIKWIGHPNTPEFDKEIEKAVTERSIIKDMIK